MAMLLCNKEESSWLSTKYGKSAGNTLLAKSLQAVRAASIASWGKRISSAISMPTPAESKRAVHLLFMSIHYAESRCIMRNPKVGLALGAGAFRGFAHIGVLEVFMQENIQISCVSGCSMGSLIGAVFASGMTVPEMKEYISEFHERQIYDLTVPRHGMLAGKRMQNIVKEMTGEKTFEDTLIPFAAIACDFETMEEVIFTEGFLHEAVRASCSIPGIFVPVTCPNGQVLVDGGLLERVPGGLCRSLGADIVIGIDVGYRGQRVKTENIMQHVMHAIDIFEWQIIQQRPSDVDMMITPDVVDIDPLHIGGRAMECVERGRIAAQEALPHIWKLLSAA